MAAKWRLCAAHCCPFCGCTAASASCRAPKIQLEGILIIAASERKSFCLLVDELIGKQEVVIKNLGETFKEVVGIGGGCILGDGRVGLILDVEALFGDSSGE
jgi:chemotaxis protein histidine kinase CheA